MWRNLDERLICDHQPKYPTVMPGPRGTNTKQRATTATGLKDLFVKEDLGAAKRSRGRDNDRDSSELHPGSTQIEELMIANLPTKRSEQYRSDDRLVSEAKAGNSQAFGELCLRYSGLLTRRIYRIVRNQEDAEDVLQEALLKAYEHLQSFRGECSVSTWLVTIATNASLMLLRSRKTFCKSISEVVTEDGETLPVIFRDPSPTPEQRYMIHQIHQKLNNAITKLSPQLRRSVELYYKRELRLNDAAEVMNISLAATKSRVLRARRMLRRSLKKVGQSGSSYRR
jgi:RNA polymerase sigma-70 factor (ECF subfamily)